jgi:uncharacterized membrane protein YkoI
MPIMKLPTPCWLLFVAGLLIGCAFNKDALLEAQAKISKPKAEKIVLARAPLGTIQEGELENEKGRLIWPFDVTTPDTQDITEVQVDARNGQVVSVEKETP